MKKLAVIGSNGTLGYDLVRYLKTKFLVTAINKQNYKSCIGKKFDVIINANGNSKRFWANENPHKDFIASTLSVHKTMFDFYCDLYIYVSSIDIYGENSTHANTNEDKIIDINNVSPYGFHKYLSELIVKKYKDKYIILRPSYVLGSKLKKGPVYDALNGDPLYISKKSKFQMVTTEAIADVTKKLIKDKINNIVLNVGGSGVFNFGDVNEFFMQKVNFRDDAEIQSYEMNISKLKKIYKEIKTSEEYLNDFLSNIK